MSRTAAPSAEEQLAQLVSTFFEPCNYGEAISLKPKVFRPFTISGPKDPDTCPVEKTGLETVWDVMPYNFSLIGPDESLGTDEDSCVAWGWTNAEVATISWELGRLLIDLSVRMNQGGFDMGASPVSPSLDG